jgi:tetratricopeptide (TPR) repeat protein
MCEMLPLATIHASSRGALGTTVYRQGEVRRGIALLEEALEIVEQLGNRRFIGSMSIDLAGVLADQGEEMERAIALYERGWLIAREFNEQILQSMALCGMGLVLAFTGNTVRGAEMLHEGLRIQQEVNATGIVGWTHQFLGMVAYLQADYQTAHGYFLRSLRIAADSDSLNTVPMSVEGLAGVMAHRRQPLRAARLLGGAETVRETLQIVIPPLERPYYDGIVAAVRAQLPAATVEAMWQSGRRLTLKQIIAEALDCDGAPGGEAQSTLCSLSPSP